MTKTAGRLEGKHILLGITGSIAAYKACDVLRRLQRQGAVVRVAMTEAAQKFIAPLTFETLTGESVVTTMFPGHRTMKTRHVKWAEWADGLLICPATANLIGKTASGIADDFLSTVIMASRAPVVFAPAMDYEMVQNAIYLENCKKLKSFGYEFVETETGFLASGARGPGRLAETEEIINAVHKAVLARNDWQGKRVLVSAGPTREALDPIRFISNHSSGKMGFALAEAAFLKGAAVTLVAGPGTQHCRKEICRVDVTSAGEMASAILSEWPAHDVLIMAAAVSDFTPGEPAAQKIKKENALTHLALKPTQDILGHIAANNSHGFVAGFAMETEQGEARAKTKLENKKLNLICLNRPDGESGAFQSDLNQVTLFDGSGGRRELPVLPKWAVSDAIVNTIDELMQGRLPLEYHE